METRYETLLDQLHTNKRELGNYRQKYLNMQSQLLASQQQNRSLKKTLTITKDNNQKLIQQNKFLAADKQALMNDYSTSVESIKEEISKKQLQIFALKQNTYSPHTNQKLIQKQLKSQLENQYQEILQVKDKRIAELLSRIDTITFDTSLHKEKYQLSIQALQNQLTSSQTAHLTDLQTYAQTTYQNSLINKSSQEQSLIKKLKREIDQLRSTLDHTQQQLNQSISEKTQLQKEYSSFLTKHKNQVQKYAEQIRTLQSENQKFSHVNIKNKSQKDQSIIRQKDKEIKNLKDKIEDFHEKINKKQNKISDLEVQIVEKSTELKRFRDFNSKHQNEKIQELKTEKQNLQREMKELKLLNESIRKQNMGLTNSISEVNLKSAKNIREISSAFRNELNQKNLTQKSIDELVLQKQFLNQENRIIDNEINQHLDNSFGNLNRVKSTMNLQNQTVSKFKYKNLYDEETKRNQQLSLKYVELKKKYRNLQVKFTQANSKLVGLLKDKIQLGSPTAASKKFYQFPTSPDASFLRSPSPDLANNKFYQRANYSRTDAHLAPVVRNIRFSPQNGGAIVKKADRSQNSKEESFYEKSLKVKNSHKFKQIKCLNHNDSQHDHIKCDHSPIIDRTVS